MGLAMVVLPRSGLVTSSVMADARKLFSQLVQTEESSVLVVWWLVLFLFCCQIMNLKVFFLYFKSTICIFN